MRCDMMFSNVCRTCKTRFYSRGEKKYTCKACEKAKKKQKARQQKYNAQHKTKGGRPKREEDTTNKSPVSLFYIMKLPDGEAKRERLRQKHTMFQNRHSLNIFIKMEESKLEQNRDPGFIQDLKAARTLLFNPPH